MTVTILQGDVREMLATLADESVHCVVTSPPYWGLRDYQTASWEGGDPGCDHVERTASNVGNSLGVIPGYRDSLPLTNSACSGHKRQYRETCAKCGARRIDKQLGLESSIDCGNRGLFKLRSDLTEAQRLYVVRRLLGEANRDA